MPLNDMNIQSRLRDNDQPHDNLVALYLWLEGSTLESISQSHDKWPRVSRPIDTAFSFVFVKRLKDLERGFYSLCFCDTRQSYSGSRRTRSFYGPKYLDSRRSLYSKDDEFLLPTTSRVFTDA